MLELESHLIYMRITGWFIGLVTGLCVSLAVVNLVIRLGACAAHGSGSSIHGSSLTSGFGNDGPIRHGIRWQSGRENQEAE